MMKVFGAAAVVAGCGGFGFSLVLAEKRECDQLRQLIRVIAQMQWELKYRLTELPELCRMAGDESSGVVREIFCEMAGRLERREVTDISAAFLSELNRKTLPRKLRRNLMQLGQCLGKYDLEGQLQGLESVRQQCRKELTVMESERQDQLRCYRTLSVCAGAALAVLLM